MAKGKYILLIALLLPFLSSGQTYVPDTDDFSLTDVTAVINPSQSSLQGCFNDADPDKFDPTYEGNKDRLSNFRGYGSQPIITDFEWGCYEDSLNVYPQVGDYNGPRDIFVAYDGSKAFMVDHGGDVWEYTLDSDYPYQVQYGSYTAKWNQDEVSLRAVEWTDAREIYLMRNDGRIWHFATLEDWTLTETYQIKENIKLSSNLIDFVDFEIQPNGAKFWLIDWDDSATDSIRQYTMSTDGDLSTYSLDTTVPAPMITSQLHGMTFSDDGSRVFFRHSDNSAIEEWLLTNAWDVSDMTYNGEFEAPIGGTNIEMTKNENWIHAADSYDENLSSYRETPVLDVIPSSYSFTGTGGTESSNIYAQGSWTASTSASWITVFDTSGSGCGLIQFTVDKNETGFERQSSITVSSGGNTEYITISQTSF